MQHLLDIFQQHLLDLFIAPIITGLFTSLIFLLLLSLAKPKLEISPKIAKLADHDYPEKITGDNGNIYIVKVINKSRFSANHIEARLTLVTQIGIQGGYTSVTRDFELDKPSLFELPGYKSKEPEKSVFRFITAKDLEGIRGWEQTNSTNVIFQISAKHSLTGFDKTITKIYYRPQNDMRQGMFGYGSSMDIS
jgi:hypothetical protein